MDDHSKYGTIKIHDDCSTRYLLELQTHDLKKDDMVYGGISELRTQFEIERYKPRMHMLIYTVEGKGIFYDGSTKIKLKPDTLLVAPSGYPQVYKMDGKYWKILFFYLSDVFVWGPLLEKEVSLQETPSIKPLEAAMEGYLNESQQKEHDSARATQLNAELIEIYLRRDLELDEDPTARRIRHQLYELWQEIDADVGSDWTVNDLAARMHMSTACFYRACAKYAGVKPMAKVMSLRMRRAEHLLRVTDHPLKIIAEKVGYKSAFSFSEAFHRHVGVSPKEFRESNRR